MKYIKKHVNYIDTFRKRYRRRKGFELLKLIIENKPFINVVLVEKAA